MAFSACFWASSSSKVILGAFSFLSRSLDSLTFGSSATLGSAALGCSSDLATYLFLSVVGAGAFPFFCFLSALAAISAFLWASSSSKVISGFTLGVSRILMYAKITMMMTTTAMAP